MPRVIKAATTKIITVDGSGEQQILISVEPIIIELNLNISSDGVINSAQAQTVKTTEEEATNWVVPTFESKKIKFGKKTTGET